MADAIGPRITGMQHDVDEIKRHMESIGNRNSGNSHVRIDAGGIGTWAAVTAAIVCFLVAVMLGFMYLDVRNEVRSQRMEQALMNHWTSQEVTAIRSYITTGKLAPMKPRPMAESQPEKPDVP